MDPMTRKKGLQKFFRQFLVKTSASHNRNRPVPLSVGIIGKKRYRYSSNLNHKLKDHWPKQNFQMIQLSHCGISRPQQKTTKKYRLTQQFVRSIFFISLNKCLSLKMTKQHRNLPNYHHLFLYALLLRITLVFLLATALKNTV